MRDAVIHPTSQELTAFGLGKLSERAAAVVAAHLESCAACRQAVAGVSADSFLNKVREAKQDKTVLPPSLGKPTNTPSSAGGQAVPFGPCPNIPPELANHPKYRISRELGRGGMGVVYQGWHKEMNRQIVIKVINRALLDKPESIDRFRREIQAAAQLSHPNIVTAHDAERAGELHMLVMEFVPGQNLAEVLEKKGPLSVAHACHYMRQAAYGLQHAHERGMVHRDIKPQNLIRTPNGRIKILDFGLAKMVRERETDKGLTPSDACMGTAEFMAPEQAQNAAKADIRADLYSLGCTLYCLLAGRPPFREDTWMNTVLAHIQKQPQPLTELRSDVPERLWRVVARLMAKEPAQRYQKPSEVVAALAPFIKPGSKPDAKSAAPPPPVVNSPVKGTRISADTNQIKKVLQEVPGKAPLKREPAKATVASPPADVALSASLTLNRGPRRKGKKGCVLTAVVSASLVLMLMLTAGIIIKLKVQPTNGEPGKSAASNGSTGEGKSAPAEAIIVLENLPENAEVLVDGATVTVKWGEGGKTAQISVPSGKHQILAMKDGIRVIGEEVEIEDGKRRILTARLIRNQGGKQEDEKWVQEVAGLPAKEQAKAVAAKLKEGNPGFDGWMKPPTIENGVVTGLEFVTDHVTDLRPLRVLTGLKFLSCKGSSRDKGKLADLSPLQGIRLKGLNCNCNNRLSDLSPLKGMPLEELYCEETRVSDLSPLKDIPLKKLSCDFRPERDAGMLRSIKTLETINGKPVAEVLPSAEPPQQEPKKEIPLSRTYKDFQGDWKIEGDELVQAAPTDAYMVFGDFAWKDYDFTVKVKQMGDIEKGGIYQLYHATSRGWVQYGIGSIGVQDVHDAASSVELGCSGHLYQRPGKLMKNHWHTMLVRVRGEKRQCLIDGEMDFEYHDQRNVRGAVGLQTQQTAARFREILVTDPYGNVLFAGLPKLPDNPRIVAPESISDTQLHCLEGHSAPVVSVSFSGDGRRLLSGSDGQYRRWENPQKVEIVGGPGCTIRLWDVESGEELDRSPLIDPLKDNTTARAAFNPAPAAQAASFISVVNEVPLKDNGQPRKVRLWDIENNKLHPQQFFSETIDDLRSFCITADGQRVIALNSLGGVWKWDLIGKKLISQWRDIVKDGVCSAIAPNGSIALVARQGQAFAEIDLVTGKERGRWKEAKGNIQRQAGGNVQTLAFSPDSRKVLSGGKDGKVRLWDVASAKQLHCFSGHERQVGAVVFSPDGRRALSGSDDLTVRLWDLEGKKELACFIGHGGAVKTVAFSPDGRRAASGSADYTVRLWRLWQLPPLKSVTLTTPAPPTLLNLSAEASVNELRQALKHENSAVREVATARLAKLGAEARPAMFALADILTDALSNATDVRRNAALAIAHIGSEAKPIVPAVANALQNSQPQEVRKYAAEALSKMKYPANEEAVPALLRAIENDTDPYVRSRCISALVYMGPTVLKESGAQEVLTKVLHESRGDDMTWVRYSAAFVLAQLLRDAAPDKTVDVLLGWLTDKSVVIYGGTDARVEGAGTAATEDSADVQTNLCETAPIDGRRNQEAIVGHVNLQVNTGGDARSVAALALSWLGDKASKRPDVAEALRKAAKDKDEKLKEAAQQALANLGLKE